jgi:hypothetical protein
MTYFGPTIGPSSGRGWKHINGKFAIEEASCPQSTLNTVPSRGMIKCKIFNKTCNKNPKHHKDRV